MPEAEKTFSLINQAVNDLQEGFKRRNVGKIYSGFEELGLGIQEFGNAFRDCGADFAQLVVEFRRLVSELKRPYGWVEIIVKEAINIFHHGKDLTHDIKDMISMWKSSQWRRAGQDFGDIVGILLEGV